MKKLLSVLVVLCVGASLFAQDIQKSTYSYAQRGEQTMYLDVYSSNDKVEPCLLYVFGGAFLMGSRAEKVVIEVYEYFASRGWKVVAIDYRLGLLPLVTEPHEKRSLLDFRKMLINAIDMATEDLLDATAYLVANAESLGIDPTKIVTLGSSAGAIASCQAEWAICNGDELAASLPDEFNYAGVISMAGAICSSGRRLEWQKEPCPMMLFHGNADRNVPYGRQTLFGVSLFGSESIASSLEKIGSPYWFYDANNVDHSLSWHPMFIHRAEIERFAERMVFGGERLLIHQRVDDALLPDVDHNFGLKDYIKANFSPQGPQGGATNVD